MSADWAVGPLWVQDTDEVKVVYPATNTRDSQIPTADQQQVDAWTIKLTDMYLSALVGQFVSALGLTPIADFIAPTPAERSRPLADPVGTLLG